MLKRKLNAQINKKGDNKKNVKLSVHNAITDLMYHGERLCDQFYKLELDLNKELEQMSKPSGVEYIYNPLEYARSVHYHYLEKYLDGPKNVIFVGMNPGPNGMGQTGVPFGNINVVKNIMQLTGDVEQPSNVHPKRPIHGLMHSIEEPSGKRLWGLFQHLAGNLDVFFQKCFVHNFCPLIFYDKSGKNLTPSDLKGCYKNEIRDLCLKTLESEISLLQCEIIIAVGDFVYQCLKKSNISNMKRVLKLAHPSLRAVGNQNWPEKAEKFLADEGIISIIRNNS